MKVHHSSIPATNPERVAGILAEILGARVIPLPHPEGNLLISYVTSETCDADQVLAIFAREVVRRAA